MKSGQKARIRIVAGAAAIVALGTFSAACSSTTKETPTTTTTTTTTTPAPSPTEKGLDPNGGNKFTPTVKAPPPATAVPGDH